MMTKVWDDLLRRVQSWPQDAQDELAQIMSEIEAELDKGHYRATQAELQGVDRGLRDALENRFSTDAQVEALFTKYRR